MKRIILPGFAALMATASTFAQEPEAAQQPQAFEVPQAGQASRLLPAELLKGPHHRVREVAPSDGFLNHFTIDSDFGIFQCMGRRQAVQRIEEIGAIAKLVEVSKSDLFAEGLKRSIEAPIDAVKNIAEDPEESLKQIPKTVGHLFSKVGSSIGNAARKMGSKDDEEEDTGEKVQKTGRSLGSAAKSVAGFDQAKLDTARQLSVDPYSDNPRLQDEMEKVTWAFFAGGLPLRVGASAVSGGASVALTATTTVGLPEDIYDVTPGELALRDRESLVALGASEELTNEVFLRPVLTTSLRHAIIESLKKLPAGPGRVEVVKVALGLEESAQVGFLNQVLLDLVDRHAGSRFVEIRVFGRIPAGVTADGTLEVLAPVDEVFWTPQVVEFCNRRITPDGKRTLILTGTLTPASTAGFASHEWQVIKIDTPLD